MEKVSQKNLYARFKKNIIENSLIEEESELILACSGGPDSVCLFHLLERLSKEIKFSFIVAHYNHKVRGEEANADELFVRKLSEKYNREFLRGEPKGTREIKSEEDARKLRYDFLQRASEGRGKLKIFIAHNKDDQAETLLLNLIRGAGIRGLRSMRTVNGNLVRPLLFAEKNEIVDYLKQNKIKYRIDKSNNSLVYTRNIMRHNIIPLLRQLNPKVATALSRTADLAALSDDFIRREAQLSLEKILKENKKKIFIEKKSFTTLSPAIQLEIIRLLAEKNGFAHDLTSGQVDEVVQMINKNFGKKHKIIAGKLKFELIGGRIILSRNKF
jgi:tRNA(Ile)-lysidine synthase